MKTALTHYFVRAVVATKTKVTQSSIILAVLNSLCLLSWAVFKSFSEKKIPNFELAPLSSQNFKIRLLSRYCKLLSFQNGITSCNQLNLDYK